MFYCFPFPLFFNQIRLSVRILSPSWRPLNVSERCDNVLCPSNLDLISFVQIWFLDWIKSLKSFWNSPFSSASSSLIGFPDPRDVGGTTDAFSLLCMLWMSSWFSEWFSHNSRKSENHTKMKSIVRLYLHYNCSQMTGLVSVWAKEFSSLFKFQSFSIYATEMTSTSQLITFVYSIWQSILSLTPNCHQCK